MFEINFFEFVLKLVLKVFSMSAVMQIEAIQCLQNHRVYVYFVHDMVFPELCISHYTCMCKGAFQKHKGHYHSIQRGL